MKTAGFWIFMFGSLIVLTVMTLATNPQRPRSPDYPVSTDAAEAAPGEKKWENVYAELYGPEGLERTWEVRTPKGFFDETDRDDFIRKIPGDCNDSLAARFEVLIPFLAAVPPHADGGFCHFGAGDRRGCIDFQRG